MPRDHTYWVYLLGSRTATLYIGMTNDLERRMAEHREGRVPGFTARWGVRYLLYYESFGDVTRAIEREKQLKGWRRSRKVALIESMNPEWRDLSEGWPI
jgi:putative endonuclease